MASLGGRGAFIGKVNNDQFGGVFRHDIRASGVAFETPRNEGPPTARCLIFVTPDAQRTMQTYLGACLELGPEDVDPADLARQVTYLEGYLWDPPRAKQAFLKAAEIAARRRPQGRPHALRPLLRRPPPRRFPRSGREPCRHPLRQRGGDLLALADRQLRRGAAGDARQCEVAALTRSAKGSLVVAGGELHVVDAAPVNQVIDTTGAGDLYAAGFLYGYTAGIAGL